MTDAPSSRTATVLAEGERRKQPRQRVLNGALIVFGRLTRTYDCTIRNLTSDGAKLTLESTLGTPGDFLLLVTAEERVVPAKAIWKTDREIGVEFTGDWRPHKVG
jgi:hypothetical protein